MKTADIKELSNFLLDYAVMLMRPDILVSNDCQLNALKSFTMLKLKWGCICCFTEAFTASFTAYLIGTFLISTNTLNVAVSTSVLFLIPGVHIINSVTDILDGHVMTGIARAVSSIILVICIAIVCRYKKCSN